LDLVPSPARGPTGPAATFIQQPRSGDVQIVASGRGDWIGWVELVPETVDETAIRMTAKVIDEVAADILCVVEAVTDPRWCG
jgi:hypothetical protein